MLLLSFFTLLSLHARDFDHQVFYCQTDANKSQKLNKIYFKLDMISDRHPEDKYFLGQISAHSVDLIREKEFHITSTVEKEFEKFNPYGSVFTVFKSEFRGFTLVFLTATPGWTNHWVSGELTIFSKQNTKLKAKMICNVLADADYSSTRFDFSSPGSYD